MGGEVPKQYLSLLGRTVIAHTLECLCNHPRISGVVVAIAADDRWWSQIALEFATTPMVVDGGTERRDSVLNGLAELSSHASDDDWVLVHDAARPCLSVASLHNLLDLGLASESGAILAVPVNDTLKLADDSGFIEHTVDRSRYWVAQTPQLFRITELAANLESALSRGLLPTDEASAMEAAGVHPLLVQGAATNIKITSQGMF